MYTCVYTFVEIYNQQQERFLKPKLKTAYTGSCIHVSGPSFMHFVTCMVNQLRSRRHRQPRPPPTAPVSLREWLVRLEPRRQRLPRTPPTIPIHSDHEKPIRMCNLSPCEIHSSIWEHLGTIWDQSCSPLASSWSMMNHLGPIWGPTIWNSNHLIVQRLKTGAGGICRRHLNKWAPLVFDFLP
jgi:hypothetical protein